MKKMYGLQLFAEDENENNLNDDLENQDEDENENNLNDDLENQDEDENENENENEKKEETVPLKKYLEEKRKRRELEDQINSSKIEKEFSSYRENIKKKYKDKNFDEELAELIAQDLAEIKSSISKNKSESQLSEDLNDLTKQDSLYSEAPKWEKEIKEVLKKNKNLSLELAYIEARGGVRAILNEQKIENSSTAKKDKTQVANKQPKSSSGSIGGMSKKMDESDKKALKQLQRYQPNAKWTVDKYLKMKG